MKKIKFKKIILTLTRKGKQSQPSVIPSRSCTSKTLLMSDKGIRRTCLKCFVFLNVAAFGLFKDPAAFDLFLHTYKEKKKFLKIIIKNYYGPYVMVKRTQTF